MKIQCPQCGQPDGAHTPGCSVGRSLSVLLRETERDIAADPEAAGTTAKEWERIRQWPGEQHPGNHIHIAERCEHGETKWTCEHRLPWSQYRVRSVPCEPSFCLWANESDGDGSDW